MDSCLNLISREHTGAGDFKGEVYTFDLSGMFFCHDWRWGQSINVIVSYPNSKGLDQRMNKHKLEFNTFNRICNQRT